MTNPNDQILRQILIDIDVNNSPKHQTSLFKWSSSERSFFLVSVNYLSSQEQNKCRENNKDITAVLKIWITSTSTTKNRVLCETFRQIRYRNLKKKGWEKYCLWILIFCCEILITMHNCIIVKMLTIIYYKLHMKLY